MKKESSAEVTAETDRWSPRSARAEPARSAGSTSTLPQPDRDHASNRRGLIRLWLVVCFGFACLAVAYFFAFRAAHAAQIREVPLAQKGGRP